MSGIKITLLGGASSIGASASLVEVAGQRLLIDCGVRFDVKSPLPDLDRLSGKPLDVILVTHGHSDHTGALPGDPQFISGHTDFNDPTDLRIGKNPAKRRPEINGHGLQARRGIAVVSTGASRKHVDPGASDSSSRRLEHRRSANQVLSRVTYNWRFDGSYYCSRWADNVHR